PGSGADALHVAGPHRCFGAEAVFMLQRPGNHVRNDLHIPVGMGSETLPAHHAVLIENSQGMELRMFRIEIIGEGKCVVRIEPAVVRVAAIFRPANRNHDSYWMHHGPKRCTVTLIPRYPDPSMISIREMTPADAAAVAGLSAELGYPVPTDVMR